MSTSTPPTEVTESVVSRFWTGVARTGPADCWLWTKAQHTNGYGVIKIAGRMIRAHRLAFFIEHGRWPNVCRHACDTPLCCNPSHLLDGTQADNMRDMVERGRSLKGRRQAVAA